MSSFDLNDFEFTSFHTEIEIKSEDESVIEVIDISDSEEEASCSKETESSDTKEPDDEKSEGHEKVFSMTNQVFDFTVWDYDGGERKRQDISLLPNVEIPMVEESELPEKDPLRSFLEDKTLLFRRGYNLHTLATKWRQIDQLSQRSQRCLRLMAALNMVVKKKKTSDTFNAVSEELDTVYYQLNQEIISFRRSYKGWINARKRKRSCDEEN